MSRLTDDETIPLGDNNAADLRSRVKDLISVQDDIAELKDREKEIRDEMKSDGYNMKAVNQVVKELRKGPEYQAGQLSLELELDTYRKANGLPVDLEIAQERARSEAESVPESKSKKRDSDSVKKRRGLN